jgi:hypothetical protein
MIHDILNHLNEKKGELDDAGLSPSQVAKQLAEYAAAPPVAPILDVTPRQIRQALILSGISLAGIDDALASLPEPIKSLAQTEWEYSISFQRNRPLVNQVGALLGKSSQELDDLWKFAATL